MWGKRYRTQTVVFLILLCSQAFFYNALSFRFDRMLSALYGGQNQADNIMDPTCIIAFGNFLGPVFLCYLFDAWGRKQMISWSYIASACLLVYVSYHLLTDGAPSTDFKMAIVWAIVLFFTSTAASSAYHTAGESYSAEIRATAFSLLFSAGMFGGIIGTSLYAWLTGDFQGEKAHEGYAIGYLALTAAFAMTAAAVAELTLGTEFARVSLEEKAPP